MFLVESPHRGDSNENTQYTIFKCKKNEKIKPPYNIQNLQPGDSFQGTQERIRNSRGKRAISVRATEVLLYVVRDMETFMSHHMESKLNQVFTVS